MYGLLLGFGTYITEAFNYCRRNDGDMRGVISINERFAEIRPFFMPYPIRCTKPRMYGRWYIYYTESGENRGTMILDGFCYSAINSGGVILYVWGSPPVVSLLLTSTVLYVKYLRLRASIDAPVFPLQCSTVNDTFFTQSLQDSRSSLWRECINT